MEKDFSVLKNSIFNIKKAFESYMNENFSNYDITAGQAQFLHILSKENNLCQASLRKLADCDKSYTHRVISQLLQKGLVFYSSIENGSNKLSLTEKGKIYANNFEKYATKWQKLLLEEITNQQIKIVKEVLAKLSQKSIKLINNMEKKK